MGDRVGIEEANEATQLVNAYRECARNLWNIYFRELLSPENQWDVADEYDEICVMLFSSLVLAPLGQYTAKKAHAYDKSPQPLPFLRVIPSSSTGVTIHVNREVTCTGYWDYPFKIVKPSDAVLQFIDHFDFDCLGFRDFQYCRARIAASDHHPELIGRDALLDSNNVRIEHVK
jgi:hypothetical protein